MLCISSAEVQVAKRHTGAAGRGFGFGTFGGPDSGTKKPAPKAFVKKESSKQSTKNEPKKENGTVTHNKNEATLPDAKSEKVF